MPNVKTWLALSFLGGVRGFFGERLGDSLIGDPALELALELATVSDERFGMV